MAAVGNLTVTEKKGAKALAVGTNSIYTRTVKFTLANAATAGTADLTGFVIPKDTLVLGGSVKFSADQGATATFKFSLTTDGDFCTALAYNSTSRKALNVPIPVVATADRTVTYTTAAAATTASDVELTLVLCAVGSDTAPYTTLSI